MSLSSQEIAYEEAHIGDNRKADLIVAQAICVPLALIAVILRILARRIVKAPILGDDIMIIAGMVRTVAHIQTKQLGAESQR